MRCFAALCLVALAAPASAQDAAPDPADAIRATVVALFDGMRAGDTTAVRAVFHPEARLMRSIQQTGAYRVMTTPLDRFIASLGASEVTWDERLGDIEVRVDDGLATAWMPYRFYAGDRFSHCGVNAMQLARSEGQWVIVHIMDTSRRSCE